MRWRLSFGVVVHGEVAPVSLKSDDTIAVINSHFPCLLHMVLLRPEGRRPFFSQLRENQHGHGAVSPLPVRVRGAAGEKPPAAVTRKNTAA